MPAMYQALFKKSRGRAKESGEGGQVGNMQAGRSTLVTHLSPHLQHWFAD